MRSRPVSRPRKLLALGVAMFNDVLRLACGGLIGFIDPMDDLADAVTAMALAAILGFQWPMVFACIAEAIPGVAVFPTWTAFVLLVPTAKKADTIDETPIVHGVEHGEKSDDKKNDPGAKKTLPRDSVLAILIIVFLVGPCCVHSNRGPMCLNRIGNLGVV
ncbi:MAG: hypothetical protein ACYCUV_04285 [Phycisphaerae bacterium]